MPFELIHKLQFQGRTGVLRVNFRSTREIGEAAHSYLSGGALDAEPVQREYAHSGPVPAMRGVRSPAEQSQLLARFLPVAAREWRLGLGACAVLCPTEKAGHVLAAGLSELGVPAAFMTGRELDLSRPGVKVLTLKSAKGLEFPVVALAGFLGVRYPYLPDEATEQERDEQMRWCASDPLCAEHSPLGDAHALHAAACHACLFAPETSCERGNKYLDRTVLVPTMDDAAVAYFAME